MSLRVPLKAGPEVFGLAVGLLSGIHKGAIRVEGWKVGSQGLLLRVIVRVLTRWWQGSARAATRGIPGF